MIPGNLKDLHVGEGCLKIEKMIILKCAGYLWNFPYFITNFCAFSLYGRRLEVWNIYFLDFISNYFPFSLYYVSFFIGKGLTAAYVLGLCFCEENTRIRRLGSSERTWGNPGCSLTISHSNNSRGSSFRVKTLLKLLWALD